MRGMFFAGSVFEPADKAGLAALPARCCAPAAPRRLTGDQIDRELETMAASIETGIDDESAFDPRLHAQGEPGQGAGRSWPTSCAGPSSPRKRSTWPRSTPRTVISRRNDDIGQIANREFNKLIYGSQSPYARQAEYATIDAISREDIVAFYKTYFHPNNMSLAVWGDFNSQADDPQDRSPARRLAGRPA